MSTLPRIICFSVLFLTTLLLTTDAQIIVPVTQSREVYANVCSGYSVSEYFADGFGLFDSSASAFGDDDIYCGDIQEEGGASQYSLITSTNIFGTGTMGGIYCVAYSTFSATCYVAVACHYTLTGSVSTADEYEAGGYVVLDGPASMIASSSVGNFSFSGVLTPGLYTISAGAYMPSYQTGAYFGFDLEFPPAPPAQFNAVTAQGSNVLLQWTTPPGINWVQVSTGAADGSYTNNFVTIGPPIIVPGFNVPTPTNWLDAGGLTNSPSRYYRIASSPILTYTGPTLASDNAADPAYAGGWSNGSNGGSGLEPWTLTASGVIDSTSNGFFVGTSVSNAFVTPPGIDTDGLSWGIYANSANLTAAYRGFSNSVPLYGTVKLDMRNGLIDTGNADGFVLRNGNATENPGDYNNGARLEFLYIGGDSSNSYKVVDAAGLYNIGVPFTGTGLHLVFTLNTVDTYTLLVIDNASGNTNATVYGTLNGTPGDTIDSIALYNRNAGSGSFNDAFFNSLQIIGP